MKLFSNPMHWLLLGLLLTGCTTPGTGKPVRFFSDIPSGSILTVNRPLAIPADDVRASFQFSKEVGLIQLDKWQPYCQLVVRTLSMQDKQIPKVDFRITRVVRDQEPFTRLKKPRGYSIASTSEDLSFLTADLGYTWLIKTYMYLESNEYPDIYRLVCGQVWDGYSARRLYVREFEEAVGDYISINEGVSQ